LSSNCHRSQNTSTYRLIPRHWTSITTLLHIPSIQAPLKPKKSKVPWTEEEDSLLPSLAGVKGPSGCAIRQNSKSDLVQGPVVLGTGGGANCFIDLGAPVSEKVEPSSSGDDDNLSDGDPDFSSDNGDSRPSRVRARTSRADGQTWTSSACWHTRKLGVDLWQVPRQDSARNTYALTSNARSTRRGPETHKCSERKKMGLWVHIT
jgi:hypothetical protein